MTFTVEGIKCASEKCGNRAIIMFNHKLYCGECMMKIQRNMEKMADMMVQEAIS